MKLVPKEKAGIYPPKNGWKAHTAYSCEVSFSAGNPAHMCIFYTGFLNKDGKPANYNRGFNPTWEDTFPIRSFYYLKAIRKLDIDFNKYPEWTDRC
jgi:hypothetical protein